MRIYLDDCADDDDLVAYLSRDGHSVYTPRSEGLLGVDDPLHLAHAATRGYTLITANPADFVQLHQQWRLEGRAHSGILLIYQDNIKGKDMEPPDIARAVRNLSASGLSIENELHTLNHWR
jgi:hypothetical protein